MDWDTEKLKEFFGFMKQELFAENKEIEETIREHGFDHEKIEEKIYGKALTDDEKKLMVENAVIQSRLRRAGLEDALTNPPK